MKSGQLFTFGLLSISISAASSLSLAQAANATDAFPKAYDATYENKTAQGITKMHMLSNGKGQMRTECAGPGGMNVITITDFANQTTGTIMEAQKMIVKGKFSKDTASVMDEAEAKKLKATNLGTKMVNGHMAQGWSYKTKDGTTEIWTDKDLQVTVKQITNAAGYKSEMNIKSLSANPPATTSYKLPTTGYTVLANQK